MSNRIPTGGVEDFNGVEEHISGITDPEAAPQIPPVSSKEAIDLLKAGAKKKLPVTIAGEVINDPETAWKNFEKAVRLAKQKMKGFAEVNIEAIGFRQMQGIEAGESVGNMVILDPKNLNQPMEILSMLIAHEFGHQFGEVENEGMNQALIEVLFDNTGMPHTYRDKVAKFNQFAEIFDRGWFRNGNYKRGVIEIYKLFVAGEFAEIRETFIPKYVRAVRSERKMKKDEAKALAENFFSEVFPEIQEADAQGQSENVVDLRRRFRKQTKDAAEVGGENESVDRKAA